MTAGNRVIKITARTALKNNMVNSVFSGLTLIFTALLGTYSSYLISIVGGDAAENVFLFFFTFFLTCPLFLGVLRFFWRLLFSAEDNPVTVFYYFSKKALYLKTVKFLFSLLLKVIPPAIILAIPVFSVWLISKGTVFEILDMSIPVWTANLTYVYSLLFTLSVIVLVIVMLKYYMAPLFFVADENIDIAEAIHMSTVISKKSALDFGYLILSFLGWILLSMLVIPLVFTLPYIFTSYSVHIRFAVAEYNKHIEKNTANIFPTFDPDF